MNRSYDRTLKKPRVQKSAVARSKPNWNGDAASRWATRNSCYGIGSVGNRTSIGKNIVCVVTLGMYVEWGVVRLSSDTTLRA